MCIDADKEGGKSWKVTRTAVDLLLWNDNLSGESVLGVGNGMIHQTDATNHLAHLQFIILEISRTNIYINWNKPFRRDRRRRWGRNKVVCNGPFHHRTWRPPPFRFRRRFRQWACPAYKYLRKLRWGGRSLAAARPSRTSDKDTAIYLPKCSSVKEEAEFDDV